MKEIPPKLFTEGTEEEGVINGLLNDDPMIETIHTLKNSIEKIHQEILEEDIKIEKIMDSDYQGNEDKRNLDLENAEIKKDILWKKLEETEDQLINFEGFKETFNKDISNNN